MKEKGTGGERGGGERRKQIRKENRNDKEDEDDINEKLMQRMTVGKR